MNFLIIFVWNIAISLSNSLGCAAQPRLLLNEIAMFHTKIIRKFKTVEELKSLNGKTYRNVSLTVVSMNGVIVLNVLSRMAVLGTI